MSGDSPSRRFAVVAETRRRWSQAEKQAIVGEASAPCTNVSAVARRHGISPSLLFRWMKDLASADAETARSAETAFLPIALPAPVVPRSADGLCGDGRATPSREAPRGGADGIEIELVNGRRVRVGAGVDGAALKRVIDLLEG